ncbi:ribose-5-phosphate isomerase RpiA [Konateibacter massiliensis]|uniref:ribose-5-phosphate isomerase RpiA n=1 Tax=Konateibacter massiliensis TaxID=2002841 RepID=UPI000C1458C6|nr:ribose-5-phosphate isomerase RpiA [Konateibacter massiliensis]
MEQKRIAGQKAAEYIRDGMILGLGTGSTAYYMIKEVGKLVQSGMNLKAVATSKSTESLAKELYIPLVQIDEINRIDLCIDGVDEIDKHFNAIKGGGGALFREKIVADFADEVIWIMHESKLVDNIGAFPLPIEVLPYGHTQVIEKLKEYSFSPTIRRKGGNIFITDNGNYIVDLHIGKPMDVNDIYNKVNGIIGVLETGLFINSCKRIIVGTDSGTKIIENCD